ncbi:MAG: sodium-dependent transporter [Pseudomonadota bacterium]|nr:sodium-dependent transporter [Pseudomonadota bacterium]
MQQPPVAHVEWSSRLAFILAASGSAVGLGNIWKFPYMAGENGGGAFVLVYLLCVLAVGVPIMIAEILIGRRARLNPMDAMGTLAAQHGRSGVWRWVGLAGVIAGVLIMSYYSVITGWTVAYIGKSVSGAFNGISGPQAQAVFEDFISDPLDLLLWHTLVLAVVLGIAARGVAGGIERAVQWLMPGLLVLLVALVCYGAATGGMGAAARFLFTPDFAALDGQTVLAAMGQAFFSLSLGMGAIMMYGSYLPRQAPIGRSALIIAALDSGVAIVAGLAIFPIVFGNGMAPGEGPGLVFVTLPVGFGQLPAGGLFAGLFFLLLLFAALTSAVSLIEPGLAYLTERTGRSRGQAVAIMGSAIWLLGIGTVLSFNVWSTPWLAGRTFFDAVDYLTSNLMLPLGGLAVALFAGWALPRLATDDELQLDTPRLRRYWRLLCRWVAPAAVVLVFLHAIGLLG